MFTFPNRRIPHDALPWLYLWPYIRLRNELYCVEWGVKLYSLTGLTS